MTTVLVATVKPFAKVAVNGISEIVIKAGFELKMLEKYTDQNQLLEAVKDVDALIVRSDIVDENVIKAANKLKIIVRAGAGYDNIDLKASSEKGITVMNTPGQNSNAVAELTIGMLIFMNRNFFNGTAGVELRGKTMGIHAYGHVGRIIGMIAKGMGMDVFAFDPFQDKTIIENDGVKTVENVRDLYSKCQYISVNLPANSETKGSINYDLMSLMPEGATLVNPARKEIIDESSLLKMFAERNDFRYATDTAPDCEAQIKAEYAARYFATPKKMGAQTDEANINAGLAAARQIVNFIQKGDNTFRVN
ncbi:MAG: 3-phosphoglycerate dehydrogenase [Bacteroidales bacterium]|nr:3-phosphoglycerate dehydrogenase [Bacteroidales bacterium]MBN2764364.1 3-phosphoglycerate dehydrogenase [Bacteroidales bacterium]